MRKRSLNVLADLCARHPKSAVVGALVDIKELGKPELETLVEALKASAPAPTPTPRKRKATGADGDGSPRSRILRLLTKDAKLTPAQSVQELHALLSQSLPSELPPPRGALNPWLDAVLEAVPAGEVLNAAMTIANRKKPV